MLDAAGKAVSGTSGVENPEPGRSLQISVSLPVSADSCRPESTVPASEFPPVPHRTFPGIFQPTREATRDGPDDEPEDSARFPVGVPESFCPHRSSRQSESVFFPFSSFIISPVPPPESGKTLPVRISPATECVRSVSEDETRSISRSPGEWGKPPLPDADHNLRESL